MSKRDGNQKGPQQHAEGQHGEKTHAKFEENIHQRLHDADEPLKGPGPRGGEPLEGHHRLFEDRQQHDEAEKNSEAQRLSRELERDGKHAGDSKHTRGDAHGSHQ